MSSSCQQFGAAKNHKSQTFPFLSALYRVATLYVKKESFPRYYFCFAGNDPTNRTENYKKTSVRANAARFDLATNDVDGVPEDTHMSGTWFWDLIVEVCVVWCIKTPSCSGLAYRSMASAPSECWLAIDAE